MSTSPRTFLIELYEEHLEEASFLYGQRRTLHQNPQLTWEKRGQFEERLEAHLDALVIGGELALEVCERHSANGDCCDLHTATCVFCRQGRRDSALRVLEGLDPADSNAAIAAADALKYELPEAWLPDLLTLLESGDRKLAPILACAFGYRRLPCGPQLLSAMRHCAPQALPHLVWALGRIAYEPARGPLLDYLRSEEEPVRSAAAVALARIGEPSLVRYCLDQAGSSSWAILPLGFAGDRSALGPLTDLSGKNPGLPVQALGLLGDAACVPFLISLLEREDAGPAAALALECLTGAGLYETVFVPDEMDQDELFESEREQLAQGKPFDRGDGRPFGANVTRLSQNPDSWTTWWRANQNRFTPGMRYRNGGLFSPARLIETLSAGRTPHQIRFYCSEELMIRYQNDFGLEMDMPVRHQISKLADASAWSQSASSRYVEGDWYFGGYRS